jgi:hypothetical protein
MDILGEYVNKTFTYPQDITLVCKSFGIVSLVQPADLLEEVKADLPSGLTNIEYVKLAMAATRKKSVVIGFLKRAGKRHYSGIWIKLKNQFTRGQDHLPNDLMAAYNLLPGTKADANTPLQQGDQQSYSSKELGTRPWH